MMPSRQRTRPKVNDTWKGASGDGFPTAEFSDAAPRSEDPKSKDEEVDTADEGRHLPAVLKPTSESAHLSSSDKHDYGSTPPNDKM